MHMHILGAPRPGGLWEPGLGWELRTQQEALPGSAHSLCTLFCVCFPEAFPVVSKFLGVCIMLHSS